MKNTPDEALAIERFSRPSAKMILHHAGVPAGEKRDGARIGRNRSFDKLADALKIG